jgi:glycerol kinase
VQAILEGVAFRTAEVVQSIGSLQPLSATLSVDGGMTRNPRFCQFLADSLGKHLLVSDEPELTARGTAQLAAEGSGLTIARALTGRVVEPSAQPPEWRAAFTAACGFVRAYGAGARVG